MSFDIKFTWQGFKNACSKILCAVSCIEIKPVMIGHCFPVPSNSGMKYEFENVILDQLYVYSLQQEPEM